MRAPPFHGALRPLPLLGVLVGFAAALTAGPLLAEEQRPGPRVPLECRLADGPWRRCTLQVERMGEHWFLLIDGRRFDVRHNGLGQMTLQRDGGAVRPVSATWHDDASLCWDGVCARGDIPLD